MILKNNLKEIYTLLVSELNDVVEINEIQAAKVKSLYGYSFIGKVYYNAYNLVFDSLKDASFFVNILPKGALVAQLSITEYDTYLIVVRYTQDAVLNQVFS
jgi:hypothetical protein